MRKLAKKRSDEAKESKTRNDLPKDQVHTFTIDYAQNLAIPWFGKKDQPNQLYYMTPLTVNLFGMFDNSFEKENLFAYVYREDEGNKGGNNVASLIIKQLKDQGLLDGQ